MAYQTEQEKLGLNCIHGPDDSQLGGGDSMQKDLAGMNYADGAEQVSTREAVVLKERADRGKFGAMYFRNGELRPDNVDKTLSYEAYVEGLGPMKASSEHLPPKLVGYQKQRGAKIEIEMTGADLLYIFDRETEPEDETAREEWKKINDQLVLEAPKINQAFRIMKLDTAGAQAHYLANSYMEASMLMYMTETQSKKKDEAFRESGEATLNEGWLEDAADDGRINRGGQKKGITKVTGYQRGQSINKSQNADGSNNWDESFIGRGPLQVTHDHGYIQALGILEARLNELEITDPQSPDIAVISEALTAIKADPQMAADRRYTYLFSAAFMKRRVGKTQHGRMELQGRTHEALNINATSPGTSGMGNHDQVPHSKNKKNEIYRRAVERFAAIRNTPDAGA